MWSLDYPFLDGLANAPTDAAASAAASAPTNLTAAALSQAAIAASPPTLVEASNPTDAGSQVGFAAQIIIAVGVIPLELIIVAIVLGVHRLVHRRLLEWMTQ